MRIADWLVLASSRLAQAGVESPSLEAQLLAAHILLVDRAWVLAHPDEDLPEEAAEALLQRRESREPLAYLLGRREFYGRSFLVRPGVLIPRQETEMLVEFAVAHAPRGGRVLEIGVGSGCVCVSLALERPDLEVWGTELSARALEVAALNAETLGARVSLTLSDLYPSPPEGEGQGRGVKDPARTASPLLLDSSGVSAPTPPPFPPPSRGGGHSDPSPPEGEGQGRGVKEPNARESRTIRFHLIVSNPPYIDPAAELPPELAHEPKEALFAQDRGLAVYRRIAETARNHLVPGGQVALELGIGQADAVARMFEAHGYRDIEIQNDLAGIPRLFTARLQ